jgi:hypothetical protein
MSNTLLDLLGVKCLKKIGALDGTDGITDSFHLLLMVCPLEFSQHLFDRLRQDLNALVYADTCKAYEAAKLFQKLVAATSDPAMIKYLKEYYDHPERFACYYVKHIPSNLASPAANQPRLSL